MSPRHPEQGTLSYDEYVQATEFHYNMQGLILDHCFKYSDQNIQDTFISHMNHSAEIQKKVNHDQSSSVPAVQNSYSVGLFIHTIGGIAENIKTASHSNNLQSKFLLKIFVSSELLSQSHKCCL